MTQDRSDDRRAEKPIGQSDDLAAGQTRKSEALGSIYMDLAFAFVGCGVALVAAFQSKWIVTLVGIVFATAGASATRTIVSWARTSRRT